MRKLAMTSLAGALLAALTLTATAAMAQDAEPADDGWPKVGLELEVSSEYAVFNPEIGPTSEGFDTRVDQSLLWEINDGLSLFQLGQYKPVESLDPVDPNNRLFTNQGARRASAYKVKELYFRYGDWRLGKFFQPFSRDFLIAGPYAQDFAEDYELSEKLGIEWLTVADDESHGWRQWTFTAFMSDRTALSRTFLGRNTDRLRYRDGGAANTKGLQNFIVTYDTINMPVGKSGNLSYQASFARLGKSYGATKPEYWSTFNFDFNIPVTGTIEDTLRSQFSEVRFFVEAVHQENVEATAGRDRDHLTGVFEYTSGRFIYDFTTTQRWTRDPIAGRNHDKLYTATLSYVLPSDTVVAASLAKEEVRGREGIYSGVRISQVFTACDRCLTRGKYY